MKTAVIVLVVVVLALVAWGVVSSKASKNVAPAVEPQAVEQVQSTNVVDVVVPVETSEPVAVEVQ